MTLYIQTKCGSRLYTGPEIWWAGDFLNQKVKQYFVSLTPYDELWEYVLGKHIDLQVFSWLLFKLLDSCC